VKKIEAFIRHEAFEPIRTELLERGCPSMSIAKYKGSGRQRGITEHYRGAELTIHLRPKLKVEIVVESDDLEVVKEVILKPHGPDRRREDLRPRSRASGPHSHRRGGRGGASGPRGGGGPAGSLIRQ
jgi:nitrogen regulatory protein PII